ncbi:hypothetical protein PCANC_19991 [Puccinia coronata f. sp. avenae]|uniref:OTU domain-containing protein n=1 Tax=Puccinia coronata f. sp. avenae TaxID=200324 RepID=A0A2N5SPY3_9BASI|nr:hypothetical protein PCANC_19991 [Puccinia coronata f. sp. avenae]
MKSKQTKLANNTSDKLDQMDKSDYKDEVEDYKTKEINETEKEKALDNKPDEDAQPKDEDIEKPGVNAKNDQHQFFSEMPVLLQKYVTHFFDPIGDGNCGFCCIAKALGYEDNGWLRVRNKMVEELTQNISTYYLLQGGEQARLWQPRSNLPCPFKRYSLDFSKCGGGRWDQAHSSSDGSPKVKP